jgi:hypothetical protein
MHPNGLLPPGYEVPLRPAFVPDWQLGASGFGHPFTTIPTAYCSRTWLIAPHTDIEAIKNSRPHQVSQNREVKI